MHCFRNLTWWADTHLKKKPDNCHFRQKIGISGCTIYKITKNGSLVILCLCGLIQGEKKLLWNHFFRTPYQGCTKRQGTAMVLCITIRAKKHKQVSWLNSALKGPKKAAAISSTKFALFVTPWLLGRRHIMVVYIHPRVFIYSSCSCLKRCC